MLLALLRDRHPSDGARPALGEAVSSYLRLNPDDAEMREAWEGFAGQPTPAELCAHNGFLELCTPTKLAASDGHSGGPNR